MKHLSTLSGTLKSLSDKLEAAELRRSVPKSPVAPLAQSPSPAAAAATNTSPVRPSRYERRRGCMTASVVDSPPLTLLSPPPLPQVVEAEPCTPVRQADVHPFPQSTVPASPFYHDLIATADRLRCDLR